ncbi:MAG TPA: hypothetical protein VIC29_07530 [Steroidobacteraceae bacterium]
MKKFLSMMITAAAMLALAGCGSSGSGPLTGAGSKGSGSGSGTGTGGTTTYSMGKGSGSSFQSGMIGISSANVSAGGTTSLQVSIVDQTGTLYTGAAVTITFNSTCISQSLASVTASGGSSAGPKPDTVITSTGTADATYTAKGCSGSDVITASATVGTTSLTATGTVTVAAASTGSITFVSATPVTIGLKGTGFQETSTVIFEVVDSSGAPKAGVAVNFSLDSTVGGLSLAPSSATSAADGTVQTVVSSGTVNTTVTVTAAICANNATSCSSPAFTTQSRQLTVTTGIPTSDAFSIAVGAAGYGSVIATNACPNVEAWGTDGVKVPVTVHLSDRYHNPVLDGTAVTFYVNGGQIGPSCTTQGGACTVSWISTNPRPLTNSDNPPLKANGRAMIFATATGEESFTDTNADGYWEQGESFVNLGEPYEDANEDGHYDTGEHFLDYNHNSQWDAGDGTFKGITCTGTSPGSSCSTATLAIGVEHLIIMSSGTAQMPTCTPGGSFTGTCGGLSIKAGKGGSITFLLEDINGNPIPADSTISVSVDSSVGTVNTGYTSFTEGCSSSVGGDQFETFLTALSTSGGSGNVTIQVKSEGTGSLTTFALPVAVTP